MPNVFANTEAFAHMMRNGNEHDKSILGEMHLHYEREIRRIKAEGAEPQNIAHSLNLMVDESVARTMKTKNGRRVQCSRGCGSCCKIHVSITREEAYLLIGHCQNAGISIDWEKLERQAEHKLGTWKDQSAADRRCIFLNSADECGVYEHRPSACRKYLVASEPRYCDVVKYPGHDVAVVVPPEGEALVSAMLGILGWGSMARMLIEARAEIEGAGHAL